MMIRIPESGHESVIGPVQAVCSEACSARAWRTIRMVLEKNNRAIPAATTRSGQALCQAQTPLAVITMATLPMASFRLHSQKTNAPAETAGAR